MEALNDGHFGHLNSAAWAASAGYKLGEHCDWFKHDNYEDATRIVTIVKPADGLLADAAEGRTAVPQAVIRRSHLENRMART